VKQPGKGLLATALIIAVSMFLISRFDFPAFSGWVSYCLMSCIPMEIMVAVIWGTKHPTFAGSRSQPIKGLLLIVVTAIAGLAAGTTYFYIAGAAVSPPAPMLIMCTIVCVIVMFWMAIMWGGWPFTKWIGDPLWAGLALWVACYAINFALFKLLFNYEFMQGAPVYVASLDPHGVFSAWNVLVFYLTAIGGMFLILHFDLWPMTTSPGIMKQPMLGLVWTVLILAIGAVAFYIGVNAMGMDAVKFMVTVPIPFIFGTIIVLNMLQGSLFAKMAQPGKGVISALAAAVVGTLLAMLYRSVMPALTGSLNSGPPGYDAEIWLASSLLAVTFPFLVCYAEYFKFWPLAKSD
jgi:hypothetical protein